VKPLNPAYSVKDGGQAVPPHIIDCKRINPPPSWVGFFDPACEACRSIHYLGGS
jgi:hypothetical protein